MIAFMAFYFGSVFNLSFWRFITEKVEVSNFYDFLFALSLPLFIFVPLWLFFSLIIIPKIYKPVLSLFVILSGITNYMMYKLGVYIDDSMIQNVFETNIREASDLLSMNLFLFVLFSVALPLFIIFYFDIEFKKFKSELSFRIVSTFILLFSLFIFAPLVYKDYASFGRNNKQIKKLINVFNYIHGTVKYYKKIRLEKRAFTILDDKAKLVPNPDDVYTVFVFVLGETARVDNFSLNGYEKETNPLLSKQNIAFFKNTSSCGTATAISVPCMFSYLNKNNFDSNDAKYTENLLDLMKKSGYDILWRENDDGCKGVCDRVKTEEMVKIGNPKYCTSSYCKDEVLLDGLEDVIKNIKNDTVIVLHTMGSHGPSYHNRYPDEFKKFVPSCDTSDIQNCSKEEIVNTYDNTILYTDFIVSSAIDILKKFNNLEIGLIYVSDHGESLGENGIYLHGMPYSIAPKSQTSVPMMIWMSDNMKKYDFINYECLKDKASKGQFSHDNLFHSLLWLMEIDTKIYNEDFNMFKGCLTK